MVAIVTLSLAVLTAVSLYSRNMEDNLAGFVGSSIAWGLFLVIGYSAYVVPFLLTAASVELFIKRKLTIKVSFPVSLVLFGFSLSGLCALLIYGDMTGGIVGGLLANLLVKYFSLVGAYIILFTIFIIALVIATGLSFFELTGKIVSVFTYAVSTVAGVLSKMKSSINATRAERIEKKAIEKVKQSRQEVAKKTSPPPIIKKEPTIITEKARPKKDLKKEEPTQENFAFANPKGSVNLPKSDLLDAVIIKDSKVDKKSLITNSKILEKKLQDFGVDGRVLEVRPGPVVTVFEFEPAAGVKVNKIVNLSDDLALALRATSIRIIAPIPGKSVVGIEIPNQDREMIYFKEVIDAPEFKNAKSPLTMALGKDISGDIYVADLQKMPHMIVAGATGAGKSVSVNAMILSILYKATPEEVRFVMIDPKMLELSAYDGIPHLLTPVITDSRKASATLKSIVNEMINRYKLMSELGAKNMTEYNEMVLELEEERRKNKKPIVTEEEEKHKKMPFIVVIIDELADLMMTAGKDVEESLVRLAQMARASGIHIILATQRPSVDVITGLIKANFPARIAFQVPSRTDSRTILDSMGAETLLGNGDMLFMPPGSSKLIRLHGVFVSGKEIRKATEYLKKQSKPTYVKEIAEAQVKKSYDSDEYGEEFMERYRDAIEMVADLDTISTSYVQRRFRIGYNTAARIIEKMEIDGIVGPPQGSKPRKVIKD